MFDGFFNAVFGPLMKVPSPWNLIILAFILTLLITLVYKYTTDQKLMKSLKDEIKASQDEMKKHKEDPKKVMEIQKKAMEKNMKYMLHSLKPMLFTFIPLILIFGWLRSYYVGLGDPKLIFGLTWIWVYIIFSIVFSIALRKVLKVY